MGILDNILTGLPIVGDIASAWMASDAQRSANRTNIKNAREQRAWEADMANTAVQRRKADIVAAGFNPVLAATGAGAATPSVATPTAEPTFRAEWTKGSVAQAQLLNEQIRTMRVNNLKTSQDAVLTAQDARIRKVEADAKERYGTDMADFDYQKSELSVHEAKARLNKLLTDTAATAAETEKLRRTIDSVVAMAQQQARAGQLDLEALENVAKIGGVEAGKMGGVLKTAMDIYRTIKGGK